MRVREPLLGTRCEIELKAADGELLSLEALRALEDATFDYVADLERVFSIFDSQSELARYRESGKTEVDELTAVIQVANEWRSRTHRAFDPYCQPLFDEWARAQERGVEPSSEDLAAIVAQLDEPDHKFLNLNAIAKAWIAQRALESTFEANAIESGWMSLGGDVVHRGMGSATVGIEDPSRPYDNVAPLLTIEVSNEALATSGGGRRWWTIGEKRWPQVLDPRTGWPVNRLASVTVVAANAADADVLATALLVMDDDSGFELLDEFAAIGLTIAHDGSVRSSSSRFHR